MQGSSRRITAHVSAPITIATAKDFSGALARLSNVGFTPNLVIADMGVLEFGGVELLKRCNRREVPVVVFSGSIDPADQARVMRLGQRNSSISPLNLMIAAVWGIDWKGGEAASLGRWNLPDCTNPDQPPMRVLVF